VKSLPQHGTPLDDVMQRLRALQHSDGDYHNARTWGLIYNAGPDVDAVLLAAATHVLHENALNPLVLPSLREMQRVLVATSANLMHGGDDCGGAITSGGTESIFMAVKTARDKARAERGIHSGRIVVPKTAHPAFHKACHLLDVEFVQMPLGDDLRTSAADLAPLLTEDTILAVGSAPNYPYGMIDTIPEMAAVAAERNIPFHVDACLGGFMLPFLERAGYDILPWDFRVPGVTSISADLHKYGYAIKGASVILHRPKANLRHQTYVFTDWPGGIYGTQAFQGTKPAPPIAAAWAVMQYLGEDGYVRLARETRGAADALIAGVRATPGVHVWGEPDMTVVAVGSREHDIFAIGDALNAKGWHFDRQDNPPSLHLMASPRHSTNVDDFVADLRDAVATVTGTSATAATYGDVISDTAT
jgi:glutamate/tyrosine decarboxylase-like PLP-dependent enzyme